MTTVSIANAYFTASITDELGDPDGAYVCTISLGGTPDHPASQLSSLSSAAASGAQGALSQANANRPPGTKSVTLAELTGGIRSFAPPSGVGSSPAAAMFGAMRALSGAFGTWADKPGLDAGFGILGMWRLRGGGT